MKATKKRHHSGHDPHQDHMDRSNFLQRQEQVEEEQEAEPFISSTGHGLVQPKFTIGAPNDPYEQEADRMADFVMRKPDPGATSPTISKLNSGSLQRQCTACQHDDEGIVQRKCTKCQAEESGSIQRQGTGEPNQASARLNNRLQNRRGKGNPLSPGIQQQMEGQFDADFSQVRVHSDSEAIQLSEEMEAQAFTHGTDIYFNQGKYDPGSSSGKRLLAHELTHVVQQKVGEAPNLQMQRHGRENRRSPRAERRRLAREQELWRQFTDRHPQDAGPVGDLHENFGILAIRFTDLLDEYTDQGVRNSNAVNIYEGWLRQADRNYQALINAPNPFSSRKLFHWLRGIRNALHGQLRIIRVFSEEVPDDQGFQEVVELRAQVANSAVEIMGRPLIQSGRRQVEGGELASVETSAPEEESTSTPEEVEMSEADLIYLRNIRSLMWPDGEDGWRFSNQLVPILKEFIRAQAVQILRNQREEITRKHEEMGREWQEANPELRTEMMRNVQRAKRTIVEARNFRETLTADITAAEQLGRLTNGLPNNRLIVTNGVWTLENYWGQLRRLTEPREMTGYNGEQLPTADYTRQMVIERYRRFRERGGRAHDALMFVLTNDVVVVERRRQVQAISGYINSIFHRMPYLRHITENDLTITRNTVQDTVDRGYQEALTANDEGRRALFQLDPFSMTDAVEAALIRIPETIRPHVRQLIKEEQSDEAIMDTLAGIGMALGLVAVALIPVVGPALAFVAGVAEASHGAAGMYFRETVADSSVSPEEDNLGVARPRDFELWMNALGPLLDVAFAGGGRIISSLRRPGQAAAMELRMAHAEMEMAEAGIRETGVVAEVVENSGRNVPHVPASAAGSPDSIIDDLAGATPAQHAAVDNAEELVGGVNDQTRQMLLDSPRLREAVESYPNAARAFKLCDSPCLPPIPPATQADYARFEELLERMEARNITYNQLGFDDEPALRRHLHDASEDTQLADALENLHTRADEAALDSVNGSDPIDGRELARQDAARDIAEHEGVRSVTSELGRPMEVQPWGQEGTLSQEVAEFRSSLPNPNSGRNIAVFQWYEGGQLKSVLFESAGRGSHSERQITQFIETLRGQSSGDFRPFRLYSERQPCVDCSALLAAYPDIAISYSFEYGASRASKARGNRALSEAIQERIPRERRGRVIHRGSGVRRESGSVD